MKRDLAQPVIREASEADQFGWTAFMASSPDATVFHRWEWRAILQDSFGHIPHYLLAERDGVIVGALPLAEVKTALFGHTLVSLPFCSWCGPVGADTATIAALDAAAIELAERLGTDHLEYRHVKQTQFARPAQSLYVRFSKDMTEDHDKNLLMIPRKQRAMIRKGIRNSLQCELGDVTDLYPLYTDNVHRHGTPACPLRFFQNLQRELGKDCEVRVVRDQKGKVISSVLSLFHRNEVLPFYAGDHVSARDLAANDFKYWEVMRDAVDRGYLTFNYGRSKKGTGSFAFKKNWGFEPTQLQYEFWMPNGVEVPQRNTLNPKYRLMIDTWRRLPRTVVNVAGPYLVRGLG